MKRSLWRAHDNASQEMCELPRRKPPPAAAVLFLFAIALLVGCGSPGVPQSDSTEVVTGYTIDTVGNAGSVAACDDRLANPPSASFLGSSPQSTPPGGSYKPVINIRRADYEEALRKWQASGITEYEIAVDHVSPMGHSYILHVKGEDVKVIGYYYGDEPIVQVTPVTTVPDEYDLTHTISGLFQHVDSILTSGLCELRGEWAYPVEYKLAFHPELGYPTEVSRDGFTPSNWRAEGRYSSLPAHSSYWIEVRYLKPGEKSGPTGMSTPVP